MTKADVIKEFTKIKGITKPKAELLYGKGFNSLDKLKKATTKDIAKIDGITDNQAKSIASHFKEESKPKVEKAKTAKKTPEKPKAKKEEKTKLKKKAEPKAKPEKKEEKDEDETKEEKDEYIVKRKPKLTKEQKERLQLRKKIKRRTPEFLREEWFRYKRIPKNWRRPDGITSKMRINLKYRPSKVRVGFRGPKETRGLHPSGFEEVLVNNISDLEAINPKTQAARIGSSVGTKKRTDIEKKAEELEVRILNL